MRLNGKGGAAGEAANRAASRTTSQPADDAAQKTGSDGNDGPASSGVNGEAAGDAEALVVELLFLGLQQLAAPSDRVTREGRDKIVKRRRGGHPVRLGKDVEGSLVVPKHAQRSVITQAIT